MSGTHARPTPGSYREEVTRLIAQGATLGDVDASLNARAELNEDQKAALQAHLTTVEVATQTTDRARPREFDANGFPVPQRNRSFLERVSQLRNPQ